MVSVCDLLPCARHCSGTDGLSQSPSNPVRQLLVLPSYENTSWRNGNLVNMPTRNCPSQNSNPGSVALLPPTDICLSNSLLEDQIQEEDIMPPPYTAEYKRVFQNPSL